MLNLDLKARLENKTFWISLVAAVVLLLQQCGLDASKFIPGNYVDIINSVFAILTILGIVVDTSTPGISDQSTTNEQGIAFTTNGTTISNGQLTVKNADSASQIIDVSASSKVVADNPDNNVSIGQEVNATSADTPQ
jgi:phi LC3 family holin